MRRVLAVLSAFVLLFMAVGGAAGARVFKETERIQDVGCWNITAGGLIVEFYARISDVYGAEAYLDAWDGEPYVSDPVYSATGSDVEMAFGPTVTISIPLAPSGTAEITGSITPVEAIEYEDRFRDGNFQYRGSGTGTYYAFEGMLTLPGEDPVAIGPDDCSASDVIASTTFNQPHARVSTWTSSSGSCSLTNEDGDTADVFFGLDGDAFVYLDAFVVDSGGSGIGMFGADVVTGGQASIVLEEYDLDTGELTGLQGSAEIQLSETDDDVDYVIKTSNQTLRVTGSLVDVAGSLETSVGSFDLDACVASITRSKDVSTPTAGPKPGGKQPANDLPSGAITLKAGSKTAVATKGAQQPREADYTCTTYIDWDDTVFVAPVEHTVWYRIAGTGTDVTVDTTGSDFDTVIAVYQDAADVAAEIACVDDVPVEPIGRSLQSIVTFAAEVGSTYYVQIGGFQENDGINRAYGTLKVAVR